jgi:hypothetical protein
MAAMKKQITPYAHEELKILLDWYPLVGGKAVVQRLKELGYNRSYKSVMARAFKLGMKSPLNKQPNAGCFKKGQTPLNKGQKMSKEVYEKCAPTMFKEKHLPHNTKYDGALSVRVHKKCNKAYYNIRLAQSKWIKYHRHLWEQANGPVPAGCIVVFKDGDTLNCVLENLELITKKENVLRNRNREKFKQTTERLSDKQIVGRLTLKENNPALKEALLQQPELIELARAKMHLSRTIKKSTT